jgi:hypothetical protein
LGRVRFARFAKESLKSAFADEHSWPCILVSDNLVFTRSIFVGCSTHTSATRAK